MKEQIRLAKERQKLKTLKRSKLAARRTSGGSTDNVQSQVAEKSPSVYQATQINTPAELHEAAKLIQSELS